MNLRDAVVFRMAALEYALGTFLARRLVASVGHGTQIHSSVRYWQPSRIQIGSHCEIRQGTYLDARSSQQTSIRIGDFCRIKDYVCFATYGGEIALGKNVLVGRASTIHGHGGVHIGDYTMMGPHVLIVSNDHFAQLNGIPFQEQGFTREATHIGENVWVGGAVCILAGVTIEPNVVVAAGAVVTNRLESGFVYGGIPARQIKQLPAFDDKTGHPQFRNWGLLR